MVGYQVLFQLDRLKIVVINNNCYCNGKVIHKGTKDFLVGCKIFFFFFHTKTDATTTAKVVNIFLIVCSDVYVLARITAYAK